MALISCPACGHDVSDAAQSCPHCGHPIHDPQPSTPAPVKRRRPFAIVACALIFVVVIGVFVGIQQKRASDRAAYIESLNELRVQTIRTGSYAETLCNLTKMVWHNTIYQESDPATNKYARTLNGTGPFFDDFNTALSTLYDSEEVETIITGLEAGREVVDGIMADLQNPPSEFSACYDAADSLYDAYCGLIDLAISPSGSLRSYSDAFGEYDSDLLKYYNKLETLIPES